MLSRYAFECPRQVSPLQARDGITALTKSLNEVWQIIITMQRMLTAVHRCRVTLSDEEAKRRRGQKTVIERMAPPTFDVAVEIIDRHCWRIHADVAQAVDALLRGAPPFMTPFPLRCLEVSS